MIVSIRKKIIDNEPVEIDEARWLYQKASRRELASLATMVKMRQHPKDQATFLVMSIVNFTNICVAGCDYCSFYVYPHQKGGYFLTFKQICERIKKLKVFGGKLVSFNSGFNPKVSIWDYAKLYERIHHCFPDLVFYEMTVAEFIFNCKISRISYEEGAKLLKNSGVKWITGGGAEVLAPSFRNRHSPGKFSVDEFFKAQSVILDVGLGSTATMVIGFDETIEERFEHLRRLKDFQNKVSGALLSFLCWTYKPFNNKLGGPEISVEEYQKWLAICRIYLDNFIHIRTSVLTQNENAFDALSFGANDFDLPVEDEVTLKAGALISHDFTTLLRVCEKKGFVPIKRNPFGTSKLKSSFFSKKVV